MLFRDSVGIEFVALVAPEFPDIMEVSPEELNECLGPRMSCVVVGALTFTVVRLLVFDEGPGNSSTQEVMPADGLLVDGSSVEGVVARESFGDCGVSEPLEEAL